MASITTATSGLASATSTWTGGVVPGTTFAATARQTNNAGYAIGATSITFTNAGAQAITNGKWLKVNGHTKYHKAASSLAAGTAGTVNLMSPLEEAIPAANTSVQVDLVDDKVTINHPVTYDLPCAVWGDDTSTGTTIASGVKLAVSRGVSTDITFRGTLVASGEFDWCTEADSLPAGVKAGVHWNDSGTMGHGKWSVTTQSSTVFRAWGAQKTGVSQISAITSTTVFEVPDGVGWGTDDIVFLGPTTPGNTTVEARKIVSASVTSGAGRLVTISGAPTNANFVGRYVVNVTRNLRFSPVHPELFGATFQIAAATSSANNFLEFGDCEVMGSSSTANTMAGPNFVVSRATLIKKVARIVYHDVVSVTGSTVVSTSLVGTTALNLSMGGMSLGKAAEGIIACSIRKTRGFGIVTVWGYHKDLFVMGGNSGLYQHVSGGTAHYAQFDNPTIIGCANIAQGALYGKMQVNGGFIDAYTQLSNASFNILSGAGLELNNTDLDGPIGVSTPVLWNNIASSGAPGALVTYLNNCQLPDSIDQPRSVNNRLSSPLYRMQFTGRNNDPTRQELWKAAGKVYRENTIKKRGSSSIAFECWFVGAQLFEEFSIPLLPLQSITVRGLMKITELYGSATPPKVTLSGLGISPQIAYGPTTHLPSTSGTDGDGWLEFSVTAANPNAYPASLILTLTGESAADAAGALCYFDGLVLSPWITTARTFGYLYDNNAYKTPDPSILSTPNADPGFPLTVDFTTGTITITANATARQVYEQNMYALSVTANQGEDIHIGTNDGGAGFFTTFDVVVNTGVTVTGGFSTAGTVTLTGTGAISGAYTDSAGLHVAISAPNLIDGTRVQLYNVTDSTELLNAELTSAGLSHALIYPGTDKTIRLRAGYAVGVDAKVAIETSGVLTSAGLTFIDAQAADTVYNGIGIDGGTCTEFTPDYPNLQIDVSDADGETSVQRLYAWAAWSQTSELGIAMMFRAVQALDSANYVIDPDIVDAHLDNVGAGPVKVSGGYLTRKDGTTVIAAGSGSIQMDPGKAYVAGGAAIAADVWAAATRTLTDGAAANVTAIKAKTDNLPAAPAAVGDIPTAAQNADKVLGRNLAGGSDGGRTVQDALRASRNKSEISGASLTVYQEDDTTPAWTAAVTTSDRDALSGIDPA